MPDDVEGDGRAAACRAPRSSVRAVARRAPQSSVRAAAFGCPATDVGEGILYRYGGTLQLNYTKCAEAAVHVWIPVRGTSQQEGFHFHQAQWVTGNRVSCELFQAQAMTGVVRWNFQRLVDLKQPAVELPPVFDPLLISGLNTASVKVTGQAKYPRLQNTNRDTEERFGLQFVEPGCRPVVLNWDKQNIQPNIPATVAMETEDHCPAAMVGTDSQETSDEPVGAVPILSFQQGSETVSQSQQSQQSQQSHKSFPAALTVFLLSKRALSCFLPSAEKAVGPISLPELVKEMPQKTTKRRDGTFCV
ncbi:uncharacterized protein LOC120547172 [Perca fluviatilis]|uniref:uncharacterized protein LOC120547172 n=1 Tax=Perca fluviatilis TaxID=8168 RepID=UPI001963B42C|nr:uncharacterized protein LOC120547172 [Perca fluviatilis]